MVRCIAALLQYHVKKKIKGNVHLKFNRIKTGCQTEEKKNDIDLAVLWDQGEFDNFDADVQLKPLPQRFGGKTGAAEKNYPLSGQN
jgi:hypothetical protein